MQHPAPIVVVRRPAVLEDSHIHVAIQADHRRRRTLRDYLPVAALRIEQQNGGRELAGGRRTAQCRTA